MQDIAQHRLHNQQIISPQKSTAHSLVSWMGAMQAQDFAMAKWAVGLRVPHLTTADVEQAIDRGEILRTHLLRPTWHLVAAEDIYWMLQLTSPQIKASLKGRHRQLEIDAQLVNKCNDLFVKALEGGKSLTREELLSHLHKAKIETDNNRAAHLLMHAEMEGIICSGCTIKNKTTYALLCERVQRKAHFHTEEMLAMLAIKYFQSHSPATTQDFVWWSGLKSSSAKQAIELIKAQLDLLVINEKQYWFYHKGLPLNEEKKSLFLLPAFDEFVISYKDRSAVIAANNTARVYSNNGIFWPTIVLNGKVVGIWRRVLQKDKLKMSLDWFAHADQPEKASLQEVVNAYGRFLDKSVELVAKE